MFIKTQKKKLKIDLIEKEIENQWFYDMEVGESGEKRPNFSAISSNNGPLIKLPTNSSSKPSDIRKLVIKNFKGK